MGVAGHVNACTPNKRASVHSLSVLHEENGFQLGKR